MTLDVNLILLYIQCTNLFNAIDSLMNLDETIRLTEKKTTLIESNNLTFLYHGRRVYVHSLPRNKTYYRVNADGTLFVGESGQHYYLYTKVGQLKTYYVDTSTGKVIIDDKFRSPQFTMREGTTYNGQFWCEKGVNGPLYPERE